MPLNCRCLLALNDIITYQLYFQKAFEILHTHFHVTSELLKNYLTIFHLIKWKFSGFSHMLML